MILPPGTLSTVWRCFQFSQLERDASGIYWVEARNASKQPTMHKAAPTPDINTHTPHTHTHTQEKLSGPKKNLKKSGWSPGGTMDKDPERFHMPRSN